jgi:CheY-like chemotaxis protein
MSDVAVLVIDDNPDHRELIASALAERCERSRILAAESGPEALDYLLCRGPHEGRDARKQPRLVILDLKMTPLDGLQVLREIRADARTTSIPVVVLSSTSEKAELDRCYEAGANSVVRKSIDYAELRQKMAKVYDFWITVNEANRHSRV